MDIDELIDRANDEGHSWLSQEMYIYDNNPDLLKQGGLVPNFENVNPKNHMALAQLYFYVGTAYGVGLANKHDL